jgi:H+/Cl- antiporter ClcA
MDFTDITDTVSYYSFRDYFVKKLIPVLTLSAATGVVTGFIATLFLALLEHLGEAAAKLAFMVANNLEFLPLYIFAAIVFALIMVLLIKKLPETRGSGIPRTKAMLVLRKHLVGWKMIAASIIGSAVSFAFGLSVGAEGPSVQIGAGVGCAAEHYAHKKQGRRYVANAGAAAGIATAFGAPLTGMVFVQEEIQRRVNPLMVASSIVAVACAILIRRALSPLLGLSSTLIQARLTVGFNASGLWMSPVLGVFCALAALAFNLIIFSFDALGRKNKPKKNKHAPWLAVVAVFAITAVLNVFYPSSLGSGISIIEEAASARLVPEQTAILLAVKTVLISLCFFSGVTGGMMVPMLSVGALVGGLGGFALMQAGMPSEMFPAAAVIGMCVFFGASIDSPFTVCVFFLETVGFFSAELMAPMLLAVLTAQIIIKFTKTTPLYDRLAQSEAERTFLLLNE